MIRSILCAGLALAYAASAQAAEPQPMESIVIQALPLAERQAEALQPTAVLAGEELLRKRGTSLGHTLAGEPGVSSADFGVGVGRPVIRGLGGARVRVQENGLGAADVSTLSADHAISIDPQSARQIEVLKGPASLLYGSGAIGGVVNVVTDRVPGTAPARPTGNADFVLGDNTLDARLGRLNVTGGLGDTAWNLQGAAQDTGDYRTNGNRRLANSFTESEYYSGGLSQTGERGYLGAAISGFDRDYGVPGEDAVIDIAQNRIDMRGELADPGAGFQRLSVAAAHTDYRHNESGAVFFDNEETELRLELAHVTAGWTGVLGLQGIDRDLRVYGEEEVFLPPTNTRSVGLFAVEERPVAAWKLQLGARIEHQAHDAGGANPDRNHTPVNLAIGGLRPIGDEYRLAINFGRYQRAPAAEELYSFGPHEATQTFERGDDRLGEETAYAADLGLRRTQGRLRWTANLFYTDYADFVYLQSVDRGLNADGTGTPAADGNPDRVDEDGGFEPDGELLLLDYAVANARFYGGELEIVYDLFPGEPRLTARLTGDLVRGELDGGAHLPRITPARYGAGLDYRSPHWLASLEILRTAAQKRTAPLESATGGFTDLSAFAGYRLPGGGSEKLIYLRGENLLDERIVRHASFLDVPQPGRRITVGIDMHF